MSLMHWISWSKSLLKSQWINLHQVRNSKAHLHEPNCLQTDLTMNQIIPVNSKTSMRIRSRKKLEYCASCAYCAYYAHASYSAYFVFSSYIILPILVMVYHIQLVSWCFGNLKFIVRRQGPQSVIIGTHKSMWISPYHTGTQRQCPHILFIAHNLHTSQALYTFHKDIFDTFQISC